MKYIIFIIYKHIPYDIFELLTLKQSFMGVVSCPAFVLYQLEHIFYSERLQQREI